LAVFHDVRNDFGRDIGSIGDFFNDVLWRVFREKNCELLVGSRFGEGTNDFKS
jgi:hypothetical protein